MTPAITHLQYAVLRLIRDVELSGDDLRAALKAAGVRKSGPGFYQLMQRIEEAGFIGSQKVPVEIADQTYYERRYKITAKGRKELEKVEEFYAR